MAGLDPAKAKLVASAAKVALKLALQKDKDGNPRRVGFAFAPGKNKTDHILMIDPRKPGKVLMGEITKAAKDRKQLCCGSLWVEKAGGKPTAWIKFVKALGGVAPKMTEAFGAMQLQYMAKVEKKADGTDADGDDDSADVQSGDANIADAAQDSDDDQDQSAQGVDATQDAAASRGAPGSGVSGVGGQTVKAATAAAATQAATEQQVKATAAAAADAGAKTAAAVTPVKRPLDKASQDWGNVLKYLSQAFDKIKVAVRAEYKDHASEVMAELEKGLQRVDRILVNLDESLATALDKAHKAASDGARKTELGNAKVILAKYIKYVQTEPLIKQLDENPFGVDVKLQKVLSASLKQLASSVS
jgi:hypothetical protein